MRRKALTGILRMPDAFRWTDTELTQDGLEIQKKPSKRRIDYYFPEGKTSKDGNIGEFKSGFVMLAIMTGARIVPFVIDGKYKMVFGRRQRIYLGEPLALTEEGKSLTPKYMEKESERFRQIIQDMKEKVK